MNALLILAAESGELCEHFDLCKAQIGQGTVRVVRLLQ